MCSTNMPSTEINIVGHNKQKKGGCYIVFPLACYKTEKLWDREVRTTGAKKTFFYVQN